MFAPLMRHTRPQLIDTEYVSKDFPDLKMKNKVCTRPFDSYYLKNESVLFNLLYFCSISVLDEYKCSDLKYLYLQQNVVGSQTVLEIMNKLR